MADANNRNDRYDAMIVGAGTAGLSAALALGRSLRRVLVLDGGPPRNAPSSHAHNLFTRDGTPPEELLRLGKKDLENYETVEVREGLATGASGANGDFTLTLDSGESVSARKLLLATGVVDEMPDIPGFAEAWGRGIYHCPYCHGWEVRDRPLAIYGGGEMLMHRVTLIRNLSRDLVVITDGIEVSDEDKEKLEALDVKVYESHVFGIESNGDRLTGITLEDGTELEREGLFANPPQRQRSELAQILGCDIEYNEMMSLYAIVTGMTQETSVEGVFAAGDAGKQMQSLPNAVVAGTTAGAFMNYVLSEDDIAAELASSLQSN